MSTIDKIVKIYSLLSRKFIRSLVLVTNWVSSEFDQFSFYLSKIIQDFCLISLCFFGIFSSANPLTAIIIENT